jgi:thiol-disulfide isomerase/thioredoxin
MSIKNILFSFVFLVTFAIPGQNAIAQNVPDVNIYFFWGEGCPHCEKEKIFLEKIEKKYPEVTVYDYEVWKNSDNRKLLIDFGKELNANVSGVPFTVVGEKYINGWLSESVTGKQIEDAIACVQDRSCDDIGKRIISVETQDDKVVTEEKDCGCENEEEHSPIPQKIDAPIIGEIETKNLSLPLFTIVLGALDGFNPCAMWALLFLISLLLGMEDRKRMWILGGAFIFTSAVVYFIFMAAWLNLLLFIGMIVWVRIAIGLVALFGGGYNLKEYFTNKDATCKVTGTEKRQKIFEKLKDITHQKSFYLALGGVIILAFAVNLVELICSAGLPAVYTQVLSLSDLATWQYYLYILLYVFIFMLDDLFVFFVAMKTLQMTGVTAKYSRLSHLIGGVLMVIIGLLLIFKPEWLMF